jgi:DNA invertase Pin-like site-specific DNA recombinase
LTLVSVAEPDLCSDDPARVAFRQIMGAFYQYEKTLLVARLKAGRRHKKANTGHCEGRKPYGYYEGEQSTLERMRTLRTSGTAVDTIAATLNAESLPTRSGGQWYGATVNRILKAQAA